MAWCRAHGGMLEADFKRAELLDCPVELRCLVRQQFTVDLAGRPLAEHGRNLVERKSCYSAECDQRQAAEHVVVERSLEPPSPQ